MLTAGIPSFSHRQLIGNFHHSRCYIWTGEMEKGKDDDSEQVLSLRISAGIFLQPAETNFQESNPRHSPGKEQFRTFLTPFPWGDSGVEGLDNLWRCTAVTQRNKNHKCHLKNPWDALGMFFSVRGCRRIP